MILQLPQQLHYLLHQQQPAYHLERKVNIIKLCWGFYNNIEIGIMCAGYRTVVIIDPTTTPHKELALELFNGTLTRTQHTVNVIDDKFVICGGYELQYRKSCIFYSPILHSWEHFSNLTHDRISHSSFVGQDENKEDAIVLIGNSYDFENNGYDTIEIVQKNSNTLLPTRLPEELGEP